MKLVCISVFRNEADVIESFVRYHAQIFDRLILVNHRSLDSSPDIVKSLQEEGLPVDLEEARDVGHVQHSAMNRLLLRSAKRIRADWICPLDADEFLLGTSGDARSILESCPLDEALLVPWRTYVPREGDDGRELDVLRRIGHHRIDEPGGFHKVLVPRNLALRGARLRMGNHGLRWRWLRTKVPAAPAEGLVLAHFPARSARQIESKVLSGWVSDLARPGRKPRQSVHWKELFDELLRGERVTPRRLEEIALRYAFLHEQRPESTELKFSPVRPPSGEIRLRFTAAAPLDPTAVLARTAEAIAAELGRARGRGWIARLLGRVPS